MRPIYNPYKELFSALEVYTELFPSYADVLEETLQYPENKSARVSDIKCHIHNAFKRVYIKTQKAADGSKLLKYICPFCQSERKRERWKNKIKHG